MRLFLMVVVVLVAFSGRSAAQCPIQSPFAVSVAGGTVQCVEFAFVGGMWQIEVSVTGNPDATVSLRAVAGSQAIRYIRVEALRGAGFSTGTVALSVLEAAAGQVQRLDEVSYTLTSDANLAISQINISGSLGQPGIPSSAVLIADYVNIVDAFGDVCADVYAGPPFLSTTGISSVATVRSRGGSILGSVYVPSGSLGVLVAPSGNIGASNAVASVWAKAAIQRVSARAIWADINSTYGSTPSDSSEVWRIATTAGSFTGSLAARNIDGASATSDGIFISGGNLDADITILNEVRNPIHVSGSLPAGRTMYVGSNLTGSGTAMNLGSLAGTLVFGGNIDKPITVTGPMTGIIAAGGSVTQPMIFGTPSAPGLEGLVLINDAAGTGTWSADIRVTGSAGAPLAPRPHYADTDYSVGGGSVALVPTHLHPESCDPPRNQTTPPLFGSAEFCNL